MKIMDVVFFTLEHTKIFLSIYTIIVVIQIIFLLKKYSLQRVIIFSLHKIITFYTIGVLLFYFLQLNGFFIYIFGVIVIGLFIRIKEKLSRKNSTSMIDFLLIGDINLTLFFIMISFIFIKGIL